MPAATTSVPPTTAGHALIPALVRPVHSVRPSSTSSAWIAPSNVVVKTTSFATVAQPKVGQPKPSLPGHASVVRLQRHEEPRAVVRVHVLERLVARRAAAAAAIHDRDEEAALGERHRRLDAAVETGTDVDELAWQRPAVVSVQPDPPLPEPPVALAVPGDDDSGLSCSEDGGLAVDVAEDRRQVEVVVADVVRGDLVVPSQRPGLCVESRRASRCRGPGRGRSRRSAACAFRPTESGSRCPRRRRPRRRSVCSTRRRRRPRAGSATGP